MLNVAVTLVAVDVVPVTVIPAGATTDAPSRFVPVRVTWTLLPRYPVEGEIEVSAGVGGRIVNDRALLVPPGVVTDTLCAPVGASAAIRMVAVMRVEVTVGVPLTVSPVGRFSVPPVRMVPFTTSETEALCRPDVGESDVRVGTPRFTVNVKALLVPPGVVTVTFLFPNVAVLDIVNVAVTEVAVDVAPEIVIPDSELTVAPVK